MFAQSLPEDRKWELLKIVRLLQMFEAPLLWGGKTEEELTGNSDLSEIKFHANDALEHVWECAARIYGDEDDVNEEDTTGIKNNLLSEIRKLRITRQNDMNERLKVATTVFREEILGKDINEESSGEIDWSKAVWNFPQPFGPKEIKRPEKAKVLIPKHSRIVLFEAMRFSIDDKGLTESKRSLLQFAQLAYDIDNESFDELLAQAVALQKEMKRAVNLVQE